MIRIILITIIGVSGADIQLRNQVSTGAGGKLSSVLKNFRKPLVLDSARRRQYDSDDCGIDLHRYGIWCLPDAESNCSSKGDGLTRWVFQIDLDTEYMCIPSSCSATKIKNWWLAEFELYDSASAYCTLECPEIQFDVKGTSDDNQRFDVNGTYKYANLSYECAGSTAVTELSMCQESVACPKDVTGFKTCTETIKQVIPVDQLWYKNIHQRVEVCLPDVCTDEANLEKMEDFSYAMEWYWDSWSYSFYEPINSTQFRETYSISWSCEVAEGKADNNQLAEGKADNNQLYLTFGLIIGALVLCFLGVLCLLRIRLSREITIAEVINDEPQKLVYPTQLNDGTTCGEVNDP